ncbi:MAG: site-specific integrase [Nitrososphaerota archaeon]|nr:site-specific integrase [Nitrososphaerota archaeon]
MNQSEESSVATLRASGKLAHQTKENYILRIRAYLRRVGMSPDQFIQTVSRDPKAFEEDFVKFIAEVSGTSASSTTAFWRDSLRRFLEINRVKGVDWDYVNQFIPKVRKSGQDRAPTLDEIRKVVTVADLRTKCLVLFLTSSGARIGSLEYLRWRDLQEVEFEGWKLARVTIYRGELEEYDTFASPECYEYLLKYRELREKVGEVITPSSPVFVREVNKRRFDQSKVKPVGVRTLKNQMGELLNQMKMREKLTDTKNYRSYEWKQCHSYRKFFKTRMEMSGVKPIITEMLMGHTIGVSGSYMKPTQDEMVSEYVKAIPNLTILGVSGERGDRNAEFKREILLKVGGYSKEEIDKLNLAEMEDTTIQKMVRERLLGATANNGNHQRAIPVSEVEAYLTEGWEYVATLPTGKVVLKLPN